MSDQQFSGMSGDPGPWLRGHAAVLLELAARPLLDTQAAQKALDDLAPIHDLSQSDDLRPLREQLLAAAEALLNAPDPAQIFDLLQRYRLGLEAVRRLGDLLGSVEIKPALRRIEAAWTSIETSLDEPLVKDIRRYQDAPAELLVDAHIDVRLAAAARLILRHDPETLQAAAMLTGIEVSTLQLRFDDLRPPVLADEDGAPHADTLRMRIARFREVAHALLPLADAEQPAAALERLQQIAQRLLSAPVLPLWVERDGVLAFRGTSDLAGQQLSTRQDGSLAAAVVASGAISERDTESFGVPIIDCQCADRVGTRTVVAAPIMVPEPVAVLLTSETVDREDLTLVAVHAARWLERVHRVDERVLAATRNVRSAQERRLREVVHEASNPLSVINNYLHLLGTRLDDESAGREQLGLIGEEIRRTGEILRSLVEAPPKSDERSAEAAIGITDVNEVVAEVVQLLEPNLTQAAGIEVRMVPAVNLQAIAVDGQRLRQVVLNLVKNAVEAMAEGGTLEVLVDTAVAASGGGCVEIRVTDTGPGIPQDLLEHVFEPGVSVKGNGRGLGLAIVKRLVEELGGSIFCRSKPGEGTAFIVLLPRQ